MPHYFGSKPVLQAACKRVFPLNSFSWKGKQSSAYEAFRQFQARQAPVLGPLAEISKSKFIIVICTRWSSGTATELRGSRVKASLLHRHIEELLSRQELLKGAGRTEFFSSYRIAPLKSALSTDKWNYRRNLRSLVEPLLKARTKQVILVSIGIEGLSSNERWHREISRVLGRGERTENEDLASRDRESMELKERTESLGDARWIIYRFFFFQFFHEVHIREVQLCRAGNHFKH